MLARTLVRRCRLDRLHRRDGVDDRAVAVATTGRLVDEALSGAWTVLLPTFRSTFGLSLFQVGLLVQVVDWVALLVEPLTATSIDVGSRRRLMAGGAALLAASVGLMAGAPGYAALLVAFALYGTGSGPLAHTADVVVLETFPNDPERAYNRATMLDTAGALVGPALVAAALAAGVSWRVVLGGLAVAVALYAWAASTASFPTPPRGRVEGRSLVRELVDGVRAAVSHAELRRALLVLVAFDVFEVAFVLKYVWLHDQVGLPAALVAAWAAGEQVVGLAALAWLDRWLSAHPPVRLLRLASGALVVLPAAWVLAPGVAGKVAVGAPLAFATALVWPLAKSRSLTVAPEMAGAAQAVTTLVPLLPLTLLQTWLSISIGVGPAMAATATAGAALVLVLSRP